MESSRGNAQTKAEHPELIQTNASPEGHLWDVVLCYPDLMILMQIQRTA